MAEEMREIIAKFRSMEQEYELGGGQAKIDAQHKKGKLFVRERIAALFDADTFVEIDKFVEHRCNNFGFDKQHGPSDGVVTGYGYIDGRLVYAYADDFTVFGGSLGEMHSAKICKVMDMALANNAPIIGLHDSGGGRIQEGVDAKHGYGEIFYRNTMMSGVVPQISAIIGPCAGGSVYSPAITDFIVMVDKISHMFVTGPNVCKAALNEDVSEEQLGGAYVQNNVSGVAHLLAADEQECFAYIRTLLSYLPASNKEQAPSLARGAAIRPLDELLDIVPANKNIGYNMRTVIETIFDVDSFFEIQQLFAQNIIVGFARLDGLSVGIIANQPNYMAGCLDLHASDKAARFIRFCDAFNIPIITLVDVPGYLPGLYQEQNGIIRHGAKLLYAYSEATVPKITMVLRKAYGGAQNAMCSKELRADQLLLWPTAEIAVMGAEGAVKIVFRKEIANSADPEQTRIEKIKEYEERFSTPLAAARRGYADRIIEPQNSRLELIRALDATKNKQKTIPWKKHGNIPL